LRLITGRGEVERLAADMLTDESRLSGAGCNEAAWPESALEAAQYISGPASARGITISGGRTGIVGGAVPDGGPVISTGLMGWLAEGDRPGSLTAGPGLQLKALREHISRNMPGWFFPPDPTEDTATIGGMAATDASGSDSYLYGSTRRWVSGLEAVLPGGRIIRVRRGEHLFGPDGCCSHPAVGTMRMAVPQGPAREKDAAGYWMRPGMDLVDLLVGSEGTLCLITTLDLVLEREPEGLLSIAAFCDEAAAAWQLIPDLRGCGRRLRALEFMDDRCLSLLRERPAEGAPVPPPGASAAVIWRVEASASEMDGVLEEMSGILENARGQDAWVGSEPASQERIRLFRHSLPEAVNSSVASSKRSCPGVVKLGSDAAVPVESLPSYYAEMRAALEGSGLDFVIFGHAGQGHLHANVMPSDEAGMDEGRAVMDRIARMAVGFGGTVSAEHGLGRLKAHQLGFMYGARELEAMAGLRRLFDPEGALSPAIPWGRTP